MLHHLCTSVCWTSMFFGLLFYDAFLSQSALTGRNWLFQGRVCLVPTSILILEIWPPPPPFRITRIFMSMLSLNSYQFKSIKNQFFSTKTLVTSIYVQRQHASYHTVGNKQQVKREEIFLCKKSKFWEK